MTNIIVPINPSNSIKNHVPRTESVKNVSSWFMNETLEIDFGDYVGRPSEHILMQREYLARFLENGWTIKAVVSRTSSGLWQQVSKRETSSDETGNVSSSGSSSSDSSNTDNSHSTSTTVSNANENSETSSVSNSKSKSNENGGADYKYSSIEQSSDSGSSSSSKSDSNSVTEQDSESTSTGKNSNVNESNQDTSSNAITEETLTADGEAYWYAAQRVRLTRRRMQPEKVLQDMVTSFTNEYNSGRKIDNDRFNEIVSLYGLLLKSNETEGSRILSGAINATDPLFFIDKLYSSIWTDMDLAHGSAIHAASDAEVDSVSDVNRQFDALISQAKAQMITNGTYNGTVWPSVAAGIERQRAAAIVKARSEARQIGVNALASVGSAKASAASALLAAQNAISESLDKRRVTVIEMRNSVLKWMLDFIGNREEVYPELEEISACAERLGFSVGAAGNVL